MKQWVFSLLLLTLFSPSISVDKLTPSTPIKDGQSLVSEGGSFQLGFFSPGNTTKRYLGIWYNKISVQTVVWVANRANPITNRTGVLKIDSNGSLILLNGNLHVFWSSASSTNASNPVAQLLDTGNLVLRSSESSDEENFSWESFNYPCDTMLPGMKLGWNVKTGLDRYLLAWRATYDPSPGDYSFRLSLSKSPEFYLCRGAKKIYASGPWNGLVFSGKPDSKSASILNYSFISNQDEAYYTYETNNKSIISMLKLTESGMFQRLVWLDTTHQWSVFWYDPKDQCEYYAACGPFGVCNSNDSPICNCLKGFEPRLPRNWNLGDGSDGCARVTSLECEGDGFIRRSGMNLPDTANATVNMAMSLDECRESCLKNCSCMGYASANISGGESGCITWPNELIDLREFKVGGQDLFIRLAASEFDNLNTGASDKKKLVLAVILSLVFGIFLLGLGGHCFWNKKAKSHSTHSEHSSTLPLARNQALVDTATDYYLDDDRSNGKNLELPLFDIDTIAVSTDNFAIANKLGEGGFGPVYQGKLGNGQVIAVKRLSRNSLQGIEEFKNEVRLIAKLQHRNLVRLLGCCIHGAERMLVYEYMHNRSLDTLVFDEMKRALLNWQNRFAIVLGIARGLLYLHQDSRFKIIHRDLKAGNILLDREMNPKISDFGIARMFGGNQADERTRIVVGTYGYMSPEYAMHGIFSVKSDVYSFGVLVLEIVSGKKNRRSPQTEPPLNLVSYAWTLWKEGKSMELLDESLSTYSISEVLRCIQVGLLCVQEQARDRPMMSSVIMMLSNESAVLPEPNEPGLSTGIRVQADTGSSSCCSINEVTLTMVESR